MKTSQGPKGPVYDSPPPNLADKDLELYQYLVSLHRVWEESQRYTMLIGE